MSFSVVFSRSLQYFITLNNFITDQGHTEVPREKQCPRGKIYSSHVYYRIYIYIYDDDYYYQIINIIEVAQQE